MTQRYQADPSNTCHSRRMSPDGTPRTLVPVQQDRGLLALAFDSEHALLVTLSWDNCLRIFNTSGAAAASAPSVTMNEHSCPFTAVHYDRTHQQVSHPLLFPCTSQLHLIP